MTRLMSASKRLHIVETAAECFADGDFHEVTMDLVARQAGVGKGTLYRYFLDKDELYEAVEVHILELIRDRVEAAAATTGDAKKRLGAVIRTRIELLRTKRPVLCLIGRFDAPGKERRRLTWEALRAVTAGLIRDGIKTGEFRRGLDVDLAARLIGMAVRAAAQRQDLSIAQATRRILGMLVDGMSPSAAS